MERYIGIIGVGVLLALAYALSSDRRRISPRVVLAGLGMQFALAWLLLVFPPVVRAFEALAHVVNRFIQFANEGSRFVFGALSDQDGPWAFVFAIQVLPIIIFFASFMSILYHLGIMQRVIAVLAWILRRSLGVSGAEAMSMAANVFVGQTEAPFCVRPFIPLMTNSQLMALMVGGFATIAGSVLAAYVSMLGGEDEASRILFAKHLMIASILSAPAALVVAKIILPETAAAPDESALTPVAARTTRNVFDAAAAGATDGLKLAVNVAAMLIAFVALLALINWPIEALGDLESVKAWRLANDIPPFSLQMFLGYLFKPLAWTMGVRWQDCTAVGSFMGEKLIVTEYLAYNSLAHAMHATHSSLSPRSAQIAAYALCGFANFPSIAIQIGGLTALAPDRRSDFAALGLRAMIGGALASWMTASIAGIFVPAS